jgi:hypothetical protein
MALNWRNLENVPPYKFHCGHCGAHTGPNRGYYPDNFRSDQTQDSRTVYICTNCETPTYFHGKKQTPGVAYGLPLNHLPDIVSEAYEEARRCMSVNAYTATTLLCRKLLMNVAVQEGESAGKKFTEYIDFLEKNGYIPPKGKPWADQIRKFGNIATHEIRIPTQTEAEQAIAFVEMLLLFVYEMPGKLASGSPAPAP